MPRSPIGPDGWFWARRSLPRRPRPAANPHAYDGSGRLDDGDTAETFGGHFNDRFRHRSVTPNQRHSRAWMHDVADEFQRCAKLAARMKHAEIDGSEAATFK